MPPTQPLAPPTRPPKRFFGVFFGTSKFRKRDFESQIFGTSENREVPKNQHFRNLVISKTKGLICELFPIELHVPLISRF